MKPLTAILALTLASTAALARPTGPGRMESGYAYEWGWDSAEAMYSVLGTPAVQSQSPLHNISVTTVYMLKQKEVSLGALAPVANFWHRGAFSIDGDLFAGATQRGTPVGGVACVLTYSPPKWGALSLQCGLAAQLVQSRPVDAGLVWGLSVRF